jgi:hypothetical protein
MSRLAAIDYLRTPLGAPWQWEEGGRALAWHDGTTVLFREELDVLVERLAPAGLPLFPALVLLLAACRGKIADPGHSAQASGSGRGALLEALHRRQHQQAIEQLGQVAALPPELIARVSGKALLAEAVFELAARLTPAHSAAVARGLSEAWGDELNALPSGSPPLDLPRMLHIVFEGLRRHTSESLVRRLRTGLDVLPGAAADLALPREERSRRMLDALEADEEHAGLALVVRDLMAALRLPRTLAHADETAAEGVADIGNRGPLDRLVLSELAHDDLTLATRVALNEALYLRREPPAQRPRRSLAILLDAGVRLWGVPRVLGTGAALALVSRHPSENAAFVWRAEGRTLAPVDLWTKSGLETHLGALGTDTHPGAALPALTTALAEHPETDLVIVTSREALADPVFQAHLVQVEFDRGFVILVERDGAVELHALPWGSPRPLAQVQVDVEKLFARDRVGPKSAPLVAPELSNDLPAIFREQAFPLRLPVKGKIELAVPAGDGGLCVTTDRRLLYWEKPTLGACQLAAELPEGRTCWLRFDAHGHALLVKGRAPDGRVSLVIGSPDHEAKIARFTGPQRPLAVVADANVVLTVLATRVVIVDVKTGEMLAETPVPDGMRWINECYYFGPQGLAFVSWDGVAARWDSLGLTSRVSPNDVLTVFDRDGIGPWVLLREGQVLSPTGAEVLKTGFRLNAGEVLNEGRRVVVQQEGGTAWHVIDLKLGSVRPASSHAQAIAPSHVPLPARNLQARFLEIWAMPGQPLRLRKKNGWLETFLKPGGSLYLVNAPSNVEPLQGESRAFVAQSTPRRLGCQLKFARWPDGSCAWLDDRGLLHLRSIDRSLPEISLALCQQIPMAAWTSAGHRCGDRFFHGDNVTDEPGRIHELLMAFCAKLC